jgi:hypothetical protein
MPLSCARRSFKVGKIEQRLQRIQRGKGFPGWLAGAMPRRHRVQHVSFMLALRTFVL